MSQPKDLSSESVIHLSGDFKGFYVASVETWSLPAPFQRISVAMEAKIRRDVVIPRYHLIIGQLD